MTKLNQLHSRPATVIMTTRADMRYIATLANFWNKQGETPRSISELLRLSVESFAEFLIASNKTQFVQTHSDAMEILDRLGLQIKKTNPKLLAEVLAKEDGALEAVLTTPVPDHAHQTRIKKTPIAPDDPTLESARAKLEQALEDDLENRVADAQNRTKEFKDALMNPVIE